MTQPTNRILRFEVPVDDQWHVLPADASAVLHVGCRRAHIVEFWAREGGEVVRAFRVYATGQPTPVTADYEGTAVTPGGQLVWHLFSAAADSTPESLDSGA